MSLPLDLSFDDPSEAALELEDRWSAAVVPSHPHVDPPDQVAARRGDPLVEDGVANYHSAGAEAVENLLEEAAILDIGIVGVVPTPHRTV